MTGRNSNIPKGRDIRNKIRPYNCPSNLPPLKAWGKVLGPSLIDWQVILYSIYSISRNSKLVQFQYKLLLRISTCKYMRYKMKIDNDYNCSKCSNGVETLDHIFIHCNVTNKFIIELNSFICKYIVTDYKDDDKFFFITCRHGNFLVNYLNLIGKWFISRCFQTGADLIWFNFEKCIKKMLCGDLEKISSPILTALSSSS